MKLHLEQEPMYWFDWTVCYLVYHDMLFTHISTDLLTWIKMTIKDWMGNVEL